jgi:hypothetical protein
MGTTIDRKAAPEADLGEHAAVRCIDGEMYKPDAIERCAAEGGLDKPFLIVDGEDAFFIRAVRSDGED